MYRSKKRALGRGTRPLENTAKRSGSWFTRLIPSSILSDPSFSLEAFPVANLFKWIFMPVLILTGVIVLILWLFGSGLS